jgi:hypothetical protein
MQERRKLPRKYLVFFSRVFNAKSGRLLGYLSDLTPQGAMLISEDHIRTPAVYRLIMDLPEDFSPQKNLEFDAKSVWSRPDSDPRFFMTGFQLLNVSEESIELIKRIVEDYGLRAEISQEKKAG